jgi:hypothetical protein
VSFFAAQPVFACDDCKNCPKHDKMAEADKKPAVEKAPACGCAGEGKECKCGDKCQCGHCKAGAAKKGEEKKT